MTELIETCEIIAVQPDGNRQKSERLLLREYNLRIALNNSLLFSLVCTGEYLKELTVGHLLTEGLIGSVQDIESIVIDESGNTAEVILAHSARNLRGSNTLGTLPKGKWSDREIFVLVQHFSEGTRLHGITQSTHSCFLAKDGELLFWCEDIGRHNAADKAVGYAVLNGIDLAGCILFTSGRVPADMVNKAVTAGIPVLVSKSAPTEEAVKLARACGLTLICRAHTDRFEIYG